MKNQLYFLKATKSDAGAETTASPKICMWNLVHCCPEVPISEVSMNEDTSLFLNQRSWFQEFESCQPSQEY